MTTLTVLVIHGYATYLYDYLSEVEVLSLTTKSQLHHCSKFISRLQDHQRLRSQVKLLF